MNITILFILIMIVTIILVARHETLSKALKGFVILMFILAITIAIIFEYSTDSKAKDRQARVIAFTKGTPLYCNGEEITNQVYFYESGTASFIPQHSVGKTYSINECSIDK